MKVISLRLSSMDQLRSMIKSHKMRHKCLSAACASKMVGHLSPISGSSRVVKCCMNFMVYALSDAK